MILPNNIFYGNNINVIINYRNIISNDLVAKQYITIHSKF